LKIRETLFILAGDFSFHLQFAIKNPTAARTLRMSQSSNAENNREIYANYIGIMFARKESVIKI
jgi:ABC-type oligopeptide transport system substrate-binding subunit